MVRFQRFKIDLIVWKFNVNHALNCYSDKFKIDLIVWKYGNGRSNELIGWSLK